MPKSVKAGQQVKEYMLNIFSRRLKFEELNMKEEGRKKHSHKINCIFSFYTICSMFGFVIYAYHRFIVNKHVSTSENYCLFHSMSTERRST